MKTGEVKKGFVWDTDERITERGLAESSAKLIPANSIVVAMYGDGNTAGNVAVNKIPLATNQACCNFVINRSKANYRFIYFYLKASYSSLTNLKLGGSQQNLNAATLRKFPIHAPSVQSQAKIAAILSAYDDLIENNKRRIALLEKMAEELYREWFVRMRFPGHEKAKFVKGVPLGWNPTRIGDVVDRLKFGRVYREDELFPEGLVIVVDQSTSPSLGYYDGPAEHFATDVTPIFLFGDHTCKMTVMTQSFSLAENVIPFKAKSVSPYFLFYTVKGAAKTTEYKRHWGELKVKEVLIPTRELQESFNQYAEVHHKQMASLGEAIRLLQKSRDALLPRLISGKLSVEDLDIQFPPSMQAAALENHEV